MQKPYKYYIYHVTLITTPWVYISSIYTIHVLKKQS